ncbi:DNA-directed RNA polymerase subunit omega [Nocardia blacklockiae]|uniref:DNA-directed RNA polymerase subunit omega n=1 Tax=Nocardia blacklockiae TaxID=480036 RepID=UPI003F6964FB
MAESPRRPPTVPQDPVFPPRPAGASLVSDTKTAPAYDTPVGLTNPPIDELLERTSSKYALVIYAAKRARQINDYYNQLGDGILEYVGPLVEPGLQEKPLSVAMREIHADLLEHSEGE